METKKVGNWDIEGYNQLQDYILANYSYDKRIPSNLIFVDEKSNLPSEAEEGAICAWNKTGLFYVNNKSQWIIIPNIKPFKPISAEETYRRLATDFGHPIPAFEIIIGDGSSYGGSDYKGIMYRMNYVNGIGGRSNSYLPLIKDNMN